MGKKDKIVNIYKYQMSKYLKPGVGGCDLMCICVHLGKCTRLDV